MDGIETLILFIFLLVGIPIILMLIGIVKLFYTDEVIKKSGRKLLLIGAIWLGSELVIGISVCSGH
jgi:hypothetical protein